MHRKKTPPRSLIIAACCLFGFVLNPLIPTSHAAEPVEVVVEGVEGDALVNAQAALAFPPGLIKDGQADPLWLERFERQIPSLLREALVPFGYYEPGISVRRGPGDQKPIVLHVRVVPGEPVRVSAAHLAVEGPGAREDGIVSIVSTWPLKRGEILRQDTYDKSKSEILAKAVALGYLDATFVTHEVRVSVAQRSAEIDLLLQTGPQYRFGDVRFVEGSGYPDTFLQRYLTFSAGDVFSYAKLSQTQMNFATSDRFSQVLVTPDREAAAENMVPVEIRLTPSPPKRFKAGVGYATDTGFRGTLLYDDLNVAGLGHIFEADLTLSEVLQGIAAQYILPGAHDPRGFTALNSQAKRENTSTYTIRTLSLELSHTRNIELGEGSTPRGIVAPTPRKMAPTLERGGFLTGYVRMQKEHSEAGPDTTNPFLLMPGLRLFGRDYDNLTRAEKGFRYSSEVRGASQVFGSDTDFLQFLGEIEFIRPLPWSCKFITRFQVGFTGTNKAAEDLPISVRFFTGGATSVRGYSYNSLGPTDASGSVVGGKNLLVGSVELERAIGKDWGIAVFYDVGNAFNNFSKIDAQQGVGIGGRYYTVVGPIKLDFARQVNVPKPDWKIYFAVGLEL